MQVAIFSTSLNLLWDSIGTQRNCFLFLFPKTAWKRHENRSFLFRLSKSKFSFLRNIVLVCKCCYLIGRAITDALPDILYTVTKIGDKSFKSLFKQHQLKFFHPMSRREKQKSYVCRSCYSILMFRFDIIFALELSMQLRLESQAQFMTIVFI